MQKNQCFTNEVWQYDEWFKTVADKDTQEIKQAISFKLISLISKLSSEIYKKTYLVGPIIVKYNKSLSDLIKNVTIHDTKINFVYDSSIWDNTLFVYSEKAFVEPFIHTYKTTDGDITNIDIQVLNNENIDKFHEYRKNCAAYIDVINYTPLPAEMAESNNPLDQQYKELLLDIMKNGIVKKDRTGTGTVSVFGRQIRHKMSDGFPLLTTKKMFFKGIATELVWFLKGDTNIKYLLENKCNIWTGDAYASYLKECEKLTTTNF